MSALLLAWVSLWAAAEPPAPPRIAVVIDDFGLTYPKNVNDEEWMKVSWPATFAVMPESPLTRSAARRTKETGHELLIHFPFDPFLSLKLPKDKASDSDVEAVEGLLAKALAQIPGPVGLNNHRSVKATRNRPLMAAFMKRLKPKGLYFLDSMVSQRSVAYEEARRAGIKTAKNYIFLEEPGHYNEKAFCIRMLRQAADKARKEGEVVVIGHHYWRGTYEGLMEEVPRLQKEGFEFVFASALAR